MDTKVLLRLIKDDIKILDSINESFIDQANLTCEEAEVALARAKALVMEFEMLSKNLSKESEPQLFGEANLNKTEEEKSEKKIRSLRNFLPFIKSEDEKPAPTVTNHLKDKKEELKISSDGTESSSVGESIIEKEFQDFNLSFASKEDKVANPSLQKTDEITTVNEDLAAVQEEIQETEKISESSTNSKIETEIPAEKAVEEKKTIEETNSEKNQIVNDLLSQEKNEGRFETKPLKSIREGIGINDRFLFIRELFQNNAEKYDHTLNTLDELNGIEDAVKFLKQNFKWNKSEAAEKFLLLIKRRFAR